MDENADNAYVVGSETSGEYVELANLESHKNDCIHQYQIKINKAEVACLQCHRQRRIISDKWIVI